VQEPADLFQPHERARDTNKHSLFAPHQQQHLMLELPIDTLQVAAIHLPTMVDGATANDDDDGARN